MNTFQQPYWGYELTLPKHWIHKVIQDTDGFSENPDALTPGYEGFKMGHLLVRGEWNPTLQPISPLWSQHITRLSILLAAKNIGSAEWHMGGGVGFEAEILLPKTTQKRLWVGILAHHATILHFMVSHNMEERSEFEPVVTKVISSLRFVTKTESIEINSTGIPIPPGYLAIDPKSILRDISKQENWEAYSGQGNIAALQAFYFREVHNYGFTVEEYIPFPSQSELGFARFKLKKGDHHLIVGLLPYGENNRNGHIVIKDNRNK